MPAISRRQLLVQGSLAAATWCLPTVGRRGPLSAVARPQQAQAVVPFTVALLSDAHLMDDAINPLFGRRLDQAIAAIQRRPRAPDFVVFGGNLWHMGEARGLALGQERLAQLPMPVVMVAGDHDWYPDLGASWQALFGPPHRSFSHKGVHVVVLMNRHSTEPLPGSPAARMGALASLSHNNTTAFGVGPEQRAWLEQDLAAVPIHTPVVLFSHGPLFDHYAPWRFDTADAEAVHELLAPFAQVTLVHGHCQQPMWAQAHGRMSYGMASTAWAWPMVGRAGQALHAAWPQEPLGFAELQVHSDGRATAVYCDLTGRERAAC